MFDFIKKKIKDSIGAITKKVKKDEKIEETAPAKEKESPALKPEQKKTRRDKKTRKQAAKAAREARGAGEKREGQAQITVFAQNKRAGSDGYLRWYTSGTF